MMQPLTVDGVRHKSSCSCLHTPAFNVRRMPCDCGAKRADDKHRMLAFHYGHHDELIGSHAPSQWRNRGKR
jgi:hypothetical protein